MGMMIVRHKVKDYRQWRPLFDAHVEKQRAQALSIHEPTISADSGLVGFRRQPWPRLLLE